MGVFNKGEKPSTLSTNSSCLLKRVTLVDHWKATEITGHPLCSKTPKSIFNIGVSR